jgi:tRNA uridine 5-carboxymethylaminomethyl modification enzyme
MQNISRARVNARRIARRQRSRRLDGAWFGLVYDIIVIGAGHAGAEAALACARTGNRTLCLMLNADSVAYLACNPAVGGTSKGHLVREIDALGGQMGLIADQALLQMRMLNLRKGPAVHSLRAQVDKQVYGQAMRRALETQNNLVLVQAEAARILTANGRVCGVESAYGQRYEAAAVVVCSGVYLNSRVIVGTHTADIGPNGMVRSTLLADDLRAQGIALRRFKTGTPPRLDRRSVDTARMSEQRGDEPMMPFSFLTDPAAFAGVAQEPCYLCYTNERTHAILRENLHLSPMHSGLIDATGTRYCPSIEDKIVRFADKERHQVFIEPEGRYTHEVYVQGFSTSMPLGVQQRALMTIDGLENARIVRPGYAIEYDCIDGRCLDLSLMHRDIQGLFFAGQIVGSSGYEEAAAQGLIAGINAARYVAGEAPLILTRMQAYIGVLIDDLVTKGTPEPYRMMTARAEYRLLLRQDNADFRLTEIGHGVGLAGDERLSRMLRRKRAVDDALQYLENTRVSAAHLARLGLGDDRLRAKTLAQLLLRADVDAQALAGADEIFARFDQDVRAQAEITAKYRGYIDRLMADVERQRRMEMRKLPEGIDYARVNGLRLEARQKLASQRPGNIGQASRISGVSPADIAVLSVYLKRLEANREGKGA